MKYNKYVFYVLAFLQGLVFYSAVAMLYRLERGLSASQIGIIEGIHTILMVVLEVPWGYLGDRIGYKKILLLCNLLFFISKLMFWQANSFFDFLAERLLLSVVISGISGCDIALLDNSIKPQERARVFGFYRMVDAFGCICSGLAFTLFFKENYEMAAFATVIAYLLAFLITFLLKDCESKREKLSMYGVYKAFMKQKHILLLLIASALFMETMHTITVFYAQLQYERVHITMQYFGILYIILQFFAMMSGWSGKFVKGFGKKKLTLLLFFIATIGCLLLLVTTSAVVSVLSLALLVLCNSLYLPLFDVYENESIGITMRASMLSFYAVIMNGISAILPTCFGLAADISLSFVYLLGLIFIIIAIGLFLFWQYICERKV
ncbi:MFS transporter [Amedibacillus dolichus]|uniref:MFS transporter n=1 Tax=Amedibacillus dolichus TaxID=31971 RepID=UPI00242F64ED|nr:MFS transporter [Amedibacillus dolichus]